MACLVPLFCLIPGSSLGLRNWIQAQNLTVLVLIRTCAGKVVEGAIGDVDDLIADEDCALRCAGLGMLEAALPLQHGPSRVVVLRHLAEDRLEVDLPVAERAEPARPVDPVLIP